MRNRQPGSTRGTIDAEDPLRHRPGKSPVEREKKARIVAGFFSLPMPIMMVPAMMVTPAATAEAEADRWTATVVVRARGVAITTVIWTMVPMAVNVSMAPMATMRAEV